MTSETRIPWEGELLTVSAFAKKNGLPPSTVWKRIKNGWPLERLLEPVNMNKSSRLHPKKPKKKLTAKEVAEMKGYDDFELFQIYRRFSGQSGALTMLADFMASDIETAKRKVRQWKKEGRLE